MSSWVLIVAYAASGFAALVYEVTWTRLLTLVLGHSTAAASAVLGAVMGGLALGAFGGGRLATRSTPRRALRVYAALEIGAGALALALPLALAAADPLFVAAYDNGNGAWFPAVRLAACLALLTVPALALGATFPLASHAFASRAAASRDAIGQLFAANTLGAALGAVGAGFFFVPRLGVSGTTYTAVAAGALAAGLAWSASFASAESGRETSLAEPRPIEVQPANAPVRRHTPPRAMAAGVTSRPVTGSETRVGSRPQTLRRMAVVLAATGFSTFALEVAWTRLAAMVVGPTTYAFAAVVAIVIVGLAAGAGVVSVLSPRLSPSATALAVAVGAAVVAAAWACAEAGNGLPRRVMHDVASAPQDSLLTAHIVAVAFLLLPVAAALGATFTLALNMATRAGADAGHIGALYGVNTFGAVTGSLSAGWLLLPWLGLQGLMLAATGVLALTAAVCVSQSTWLWPYKVGALAALAGAVWGTGALGPWDRELLAGGAYKYAASIPPGLDVQAALKAGTLLYYREGASSTVSVKRTTGALSLAIDGKVDASTAGDSLTQKTLAHLPLLMHDAPRRVAIIGLGSGMTAAAALTHPIDALDIVELSPEVVEASRFFAAGGRSPLDDARTRVVVGDGRTHLALATETYDVIVSEPSNPWMAGVAALFTRQFFEQARDRLAPDGLLCQWTHTYDISLDDLRSVVATFGAVFPTGTMWLVGDGDLLLIGRADSATSAVRSGEGAVPSTDADQHLEAIARSWGRPGVPDDLTDVGVTTPFGILSMYLGGPTEIARIAANGVIQEDDRLALEFSAPRSVRTTAREATVSALRQLVVDGVRPAVVDAAWASAGAAERAARGTMLQRAGAFESAFAEYSAAARLPGADARALDGLVQTAAATGRQTAALAVLESLIETDPRAPAPRVALSRLQALMGDLAGAIDAAALACEIEPPSAEAFEQLASLFADVGDAKQLSEVVTIMERAFPESAATAYYSGAAHFLNGDQTKALQYVQLSLQRDSARARTFTLLGAIHASSAREAEAREAFTTSLRLDPRDPATYQNLGALDLSAGRADAAARWFMEALVLDPSSESARQGFADARRAHAQAASPRHTQ